MKASNSIFKSTYRDSIVLMRLSQQLEDIDGVSQAAAIMGTENNKLLLDEAELLTDPGRKATANDIILAVSPSSPVLDAAVLELAQQLLTVQKGSGEEVAEYQPKTLDGALDTLPDANLAIISVPGEYAAYEARKALDRGLHVLLFSDNVSLEDEVELKQRALAVGLFMLGPDCGTAIINNVPLGFANVVPPGPVGLVSASGTGLQQVVCLLADAGEGVSQALGVGGRDLDDRVGGLMMLEGLQTLESDPDTEVIVLISKPPGPVTSRRVMDALGRTAKPCVVCFLGADRPPETFPHVYHEADLESAASRALRLLPGRPDAPLQLPPLPAGLIQQLTAALSPERRRVTGLFSGGTLCYEALLLLRDLVHDPIYSNLHLPGVLPLDGNSSGPGHTLLDLGDDRLTRGRPHPMLVLRDRAGRLVRAAQDPAVGIILLDVVLGHGAHPDPASELAPALREARRRAAEAGHGLACIVSLCGAPADSQSPEAQRQALEDAGALVVRSNAQAVRVAAALSRDDLSTLA